MQLPIAQLPFVHWWGLTNQRHDNRPIRRVSHARCCARGGLLMPRELFGDVTDPSITVGSRKWYTVPLSLAAHTLVLSIVVVIPLMATGVLPMPRSTDTFMIVEPPPLPV